ncbi:MAG: 2-iminoacetate synthase [Firmicutes bacterium]|nr:2-iminoacetate synthase [Bacillota bacterium]
MEDILAKAEACVGLTAEEAAELLALPEHFDDMLFASAKRVKQKLYGARVVLFAPLYISNMCTNSCLYCSFRQENTLLMRRKLSQAEIAEQAKVLINMGHKRVLLETGEDLAATPLDYVLESIHTIYHVGHSGREIRRVNVNIAATSVENYRELKAAGIGTYQLFQETYHEPTYQLMHPRGPKADYRYHLTAMDRAIEGGIEDFGLGVLLGLYDYRQDTQSLITHAHELKSRWGIGPHTVSVPRLRPAKNTRCPDTYLLNDQQFARVVAVLRLALPLAGIILSTREAPVMRDFLLDVGVSQMSAASSTAPGGYGRESESRQFEGIDHRSLDEVVEGIIRRGYVPSFCTGCYRKERRGNRFMQLVEHGHIKDMCQANALLTLAEYVLQFASPAAKEAANARWEQWLLAIPAGAMRDSARMKLERALAGESDVYV